MNSNNTPSIDTTLQKVSTFWQKIDLAFLDLTEEIFNHCYSTPELLHEKDRVKQILTLRYPKNPGLDGLMDKIRVLYIARYGFLLRLERDGKIAGNPELPDPQEEIITDQLKPRDQGEPDQGGASRRTVRDQGKRGAK